MVMSSACVIGARWLVVVAVCVPVLVFILVCCLAVYDWFALESNKKFLPSGELSSTCIVFPLPVSLLCILNEGACALRFDVYQIRCVRACCEVYMLLASIEAFVSWCT